MAQPPKTPAPPRRKASATSRTSTRGRPRKTSAATADGTGAATAATPARRKPGPKPKTAVTTSVEATASDVAKVVRTKASATKGNVKKAASNAAHAVTDSAPAQFVSDTREKLGDRNFIAALVGGVAAIGAAITGIALALRDGNPASPDTKTRRGRGKS